jgi:ferredoxin-NADP reductase
MHKYRVRENKLLTPTTLLLTLEKCDVNDTFRYQAGQYGAISFNINGHQSPARCFSIASSPDEPNILQFSIRLKGRYTNTVSRLKHGDLVNVRGPYGSFVIDANRDHNVVMIAGGIGIAPFIGMMRQAASYKYYDKISLIYSTSSQEDVPFLDELTKNEATNVDLKNTFVISHGPTEKLANLNVKNGRVTPEIIDEATGSQYSDKTFYICGPPQFMKSMVDTLRNKKVTSDRIITEAFGQGSIQQTGKLKSWPNSIYAMGAVGIAVASFAVMISDMLKNLPTGLTTPSNLVDSNFPTNSRQAELDDLVNKLPDDINEAPATAATKPLNPSTTGSTSTNTVATPPNTTTTTTPVVTTPTPKCTTTQSGVTTCI